MTSRTSCVACENKNTNGLFKCEGCSQSFCLKHTNEHRDFLDYQLDEILHEHNHLYTLFNENKQHSSVLFDQINQWEIDSLAKIKQTAHDLRKQIEQLSRLQKQQTRERYCQLTNELERACNHHEYLENDLHRWRIVLVQLNYDLTSLSPSVILHQDQRQTLVPNIYISQINQESLLNETLVSDSNSIEFDDNHHIAMHCGPYRTPAYISGTQEYSSGQHQVRLFLSKQTNEFILSFNIMSKSMPMPSTVSQSEFLTYGWQSDDYVNPSKYCSSDEKHYPDLKGNTKFYLELIIDCEQKKICYFNEKTKRKREINVDIDKCPLPWKLYFYLYDIGDSVRLLSSSKMS